MFYYSHKICRRGKKRLAHAAVKPSFTTLPGGLYIGEVLNQSL